MRGAAFEDTASYWRWCGLFPYLRAGGSYAHSARYAVLGPSAAFLSCFTVVWYQTNRDFLQISEYFLGTIVFGFLLRQSLIFLTFFRVGSYSSDVKGMLERLEDIDDSLFLQGLVKDPPKFRSSVPFHFLFSVLMVAYQTFVTPDEHYKFILCYFVSRLIWVLCILQMVDLLNILRHYFETLERLGRSARATRQVLCLARCRDKLWMVASSFQSTFDLNLLLALTSLFTLVITYKAIYLFSDDDLNFSVSSLDIVILNILPLLAMIFQLVHPCTRIGESASRFNIHLCRSLLNDGTGRMSRDRMLQLHVAVKREVVFTAYGFVTVDYTLIHSMVAAVTTYLVIISQFGEPISAG